jgi:prepilin-type N-terminal cleavage/methylation domain-containing protein
LNKNILNKKGFTLIEILVSLSIFIVVVSITYMLLNSSNNLLVTQSNTFNIQQGINLTKKYLTKDLEGAISTKLKDKNSAEVTLDTILKNVSKDTVYYKYEIITLDNNLINYEVKINKKGDKYLYSLYRSYNNNINIIEDQPIKYSKSNGNANIEVPFEVKNNNNLYEVNIQYLDRKQTKSYKFKVYKRTDIIENLG